MPKRIAICCDGTDNQFDGDHTNVIRAYKVIRHDDEQLCFYDPGVGTMPEPWQTSKLGKRWSMLKGLATRHNASSTVRPISRTMSRACERRSRSKVNHTGRRHF